MADVFSHVIQDLGLILRPPESLVLVETRSSFPSSDLLFPVDVWKEAVSPLLTPCTRDNAKGLA
jgi:hypothetical protein